MTDEDKEAEYGWGMDIRASLRKGFNRLKEEVDSLKLKKCLFVPKPKSLPTSCMAQSTLQGDYGEDIIIAGTRKKLLKDNDGVVELNEQHKGQGSAVKDNFVHHLLCFEDLVNVPVMSAEGLFDKVDGVDKPGNVDVDQGPECQGDNGGVGSLFQIRSGLLG
ncbi:unnamed protein product [Amaranthus hypochondriacus]